MHPSKMAVLSKHYVVRVCSCAAIEIFLADSLTLPRPATGQMGNRISQVCFLQITQPIKDIRYNIEKRDLLDNTVSMHAAYFDNLIKRIESDVLAQVSADSPRSVLDLDTYIRCAG
jgi:hypothetical protein